MVEIKGSSFLLRPYREGDEASLVQAINHKKIYETTASIPYPFTLQDAEGWIENTTKKPSSFNLALDIDGKVLGGIGIHDMNHYKGEIGYWIAPAFWGKGIATEALTLVTNYAFQTLKLQRVYAYVFSFNPASARVMEKVGYEKEGLLKKNFEKNGVICNEFLYAKVK